MTRVTVAALSVTPVKGMRLLPVESIMLEEQGAQDDRRFFLVDESDRMVNGKMLGTLQEITAAFDSERRVLRLTFPDGRVVEDAVAVGDLVEAKFFSRGVAGRAVSGPWSEAISAHVDRPVRLIMTTSAVDRGRKGGASLVSRGSLQRLASQGGLDSLDGRRFRMLIEIDGVDAHEEDEWVGRSIRVGDALVRFEGHVGRCLVTSRNPVSGVVDLPTLDLLRAYRGSDNLEATEPLPFGIYGRVVQPGAVRIGDPVTVGSPA